MCAVQEPCSPHSCQTCPANLFCCQLSSVLLFQSSLQQSWLFVRLDIFLSLFHRKLGICKYSIRRFLLAYLRKEFFANVWMIFCFCSDSFSWIILTKFRLYYVCIICILLSRNLYCRIFDGQKNILHDAIEGFLRYRLVILRFSFWKIWKCQTHSEETVQVICLSFFLECAPQYVRSTFLHSFNEDYCLVVLSNSSLSKSEFDTCIRENSFLFKRFWHRTSLSFFSTQCIDQQSPCCRDQLASCFSLLACHHTSETWIIHWFD